MSFLYSIKDPTPLVLIGGISGIGKTSIINFLLEKYSEVFCQPKSYTSRKIRGDNDRYIFKEKEEIKAMYDKGLLYNLDVVYNNYYSISKHSVSSLIRSGKIPVKEVHPNNFNKFKGICTITIVIENTENNKNTPHKEREERPLKEKWEDENLIDIKINTCGLSVEESSHYLIRRIFAFRKHIKEHPHPNIIDETNYVGYSKLAKEFNDSERITTKNFHDISIPFWEVSLSSIKPTDKILEVGVGNGWLFSTFPPPSKDIYGVDISNDMSASYISKKITSTSRNIPIRSNEIDSVVGSLADPFLYPETVLEISRVLRVGGCFSFTYPSLVWANNFKQRKNKSKTTFITKEGENVEVYSLCRGVEGLSEIIALSDLEIIFLREYYLPRNYLYEVSEAITSSAKNFGKERTDLPIVIGGILRKIK